VRKPLLPESVRSLDLALVEKTLIECLADVTAAAHRLGVKPADLRALVRISPALQDAVFETIEGKLDEAQSILFKSLKHRNLSVRLDSAQFVLRYNTASTRRGWSRTRVVARAHEYDHREEPAAIEWIEPAAIEDDAPPKETIVDEPPPLTEEEIKRLKAQEAAAIAGFPLDELAAYGARLKAANRAELVRWFRAAADALEMLELTSEAMAPVRGDVLSKARD
jgi:hypothetical protein